MSACRSCGAPIIWVGTEHGKRMALDAEPVDPDEVGPSGLFVIRTGEKVLALAVPPGVFQEPHYRAHWATCPQADEWRRS